MNEDLKFKIFDATDSDNPHMTREMSLLDFCGYVNHYFTEEDLNKIDVLRYTGLKDKNGKEIWEGDIVSIYEVYVSCNECGSKEEHTKYLEVKFKDGVFTASHYGLRSLANNTKIIGNIYEDPELLNDL